MKHRLILSLMLTTLCLPAISQVPNPVGSTEPVQAATLPTPPAPAAKSSPASDSLMRAARAAVAEQKVFDSMLEQAKKSLNTSIADLKKQNNDLTQRLNDKLRADKKYKPMLDQIDGIDKQIQDLNSKAGTQFSKDVVPIQNQIASDHALIDGLVPVVRKENGWPDTVIFDAATQTWKGIPQSTAEQK